MSALQVQAPSSSSTRTAVSTDRSSPRRSIRPDVNPAQTFNPLANPPELVFTQSKAMGSHPHQLLRHDQAQGVAASPPLSASGAHLQTKGMRATPHPLHGRTCISCCDMTRRTASQPPALSPPVVRTSKQRE
eukprot:366447-Chlamydomonas_euryale.AAC.6